MTPLGRKTFVFLLIPKATNMLAAVDVLAGSHLEDLKESVRFDFFLILHPLPLLNQLSHQVHHSS